MSKLKTKKTKSKKITILSLGYWFSSVTLGLLLHPYKTMRKIMRERSWWILSLTPLVWGVVLFLCSIGLVLVFRVFGLWMSLIYSWWIYKLIEWLFWWVVWFLVLWQILVGHLYVRLRKIV